MDADLVGASRLEGALDECGAVERRDHAHVGHRPLASVHPRREADPVGRMAPVERRERARLRDADDDRHVGPVDRVLLELRLEPLARLDVPCDDHDAARALVQAVHDARAHVLGRIGVAREVLATKEAQRQQTVHQGPPRVPARRVNDETRRLVDDDDVLVRVDDVEADVGFRLRLGGRRWLGPHDHALAPVQRGARFARHAVDRHAPASDPPLDLGPRHPERIRGETVEARARGLVRHDEIHGVHRCRGRRAGRHQSFDLMWPFALMRMSTRALS
jgi:hypothetical protein